MNATARKPQTVAPGNRPGATPNKEPKPTGANQWCFRSAATRQRSQWTTPSGWVMPTG